MKMIAATKLNKAQRAVQSAKAYGSANASTGSIWLWCLLRVDIGRIAQASSSSPKQLPQREARSSTSSSPPTRVFAVVFTPQCPKQRGLL